MVATLGVYSKASGKVTPQRLTSGNFGEKWSKRTFGNIGARYAAWCSTMGAQVTIWDPYAPDAPFATAGARRCFHLAELVKDSEIFVPMVPSVS